MTTAFNRGKDHALDSHVFDPPVNRYEKDDYHAGYKEGHDLVCERRARGQRKRYYRD